MYTLGEHVNRFFWTLINIVISTKLTVADILINYYTFLKATALTQGLK